MNVDVVTLEDNLSYLIIDTIMYEDNKYLVMVNKDDNQDIVIRKVIYKEGREFLVKLDSEDEFEIIMSLFYDKHKEGNENEK